MIYTVVPCLDWRSRLRGIHAAAGLNVDGVLLAPCRAVHFFGVRVPLVVCFVGRDGRVFSHARREAWGPPAADLRAWGALELFAERVPAGWSPTEVAWRARG